MWRRSKPRSAGIFLTRDTLQPVSADPVMYWPFFEIDYHVRLLLNPAAGQS